MMPSWRVSSVLKTMFGNVNAGNDFLNKEIGIADDVGDECGKHEKSEEGLIERKISQRHMKRGSQIMRLQNKA